MPNTETKDVFPRKLLTPASGYLKRYTHTLNPYAGCSFGCAYCYVRRLPVALFKEKEWGTWVDLKRVAAERFARELERAGRKGAVTIFMSSATDPYQPVEYREEITRGLLRVMAETPPDFLWVQTRSPLVTRDADLLKALGDRVRVSMTVETDLERVRKVLTPYAPPVKARLKAIEELSRQGVDVQATVSPVLPCSEHFAETLCGIVERIGIDDFFMGDGSGGRRTESLGMRRIFREHGWEDWYERDAYIRVLGQFRRHFPPEQIRISTEAFI